MFAYPTVNSHIYPVPTYTLPNEMTERATKQQCQPSQSEEIVERETEEEQMPLREKMSAPPPYSAEDPSSINLEQFPSIMTKKAPSLLLEVALGYKLAKKLTEKRQKGKEAQLQKVHDAWMKLGVNTRLIASQGGELPPHFWNPPNCGPEEMNAQLAQLGL